MMNHFPCWNSACKNELSRSWEEVEDDISGRMAYCSEGCFEEDCKRESDRFNSAHSLVNLTKPYVVTLSQKWHCSRPYSSKTHT